MPGIVSAPRGKLYVMGNRTHDRADTPPHLSSLRLLEKPHSGGARPQDRGLVPVRGLPCPRLRFRHGVLGEVFML